MDRSPADLRSLRARICAIGPATRAAIEALHLKVDLMGAEYVAEGLLKAFANQSLEGARILLPRAAVARDLIPVELARRGAQVDVVEAYRTALPQDAAVRAREIFGASPKPDWIAFTSSSTVRNFASVAALDVLAGVRVASIGHHERRARPRDRGRRGSARVHHRRLGGSLTSRAGSRQAVAAARPTLAASRHR
jgi:uroporphyrinogen-III synthase